MMKRSTTCVEVQSKRPRQDDAWALQRAEALTRQIGVFAQQKQLQKALDTYHQLLEAGLPPSGYTFSNLINAHIMSGDVAGAEHLLAEMQSAGFAPNVVVYTTLLKGHCAVGDVHAAAEVLRRMTSATPPVVPDIRACNTFLRGCIRVGDLGAARWAWGEMASWRVTPDHTAHVNMARLRSQGLYLGELRAMLREAAPAADGAAAVPPGAHAVRQPRQNSCKFWEEGRCERGANCKFWHDPKVAQRGAAQQQAEARAARLVQLVSLAHAAALLGRSAACRHAMTSAEALLTQLQQPAAASAHAATDDDTGAWGDEESTSTVFRRAEMAREVTRLRAYLRGAAQPPPLGRYYQRAFVFSSRLLSEGDGPYFDAAKLPPAPPLRRSGGGGSGEDGGGGAHAEVCGRLLTALRLTFGLEQAARLGVASLEQSARRLGRAVSSRGRLRWRRIFGAGKGGSGGGSGGGGGGGAELPVKLEVASGTGDWVVAQALAEAGRAHWAALELRHDRVYDIFSRMVLRAVPNLAVIGGDAAQVLRRHVAPRSVAHVFVNFPEPPHRAIGRGSGIDESAANALALLTPAFFRDMRRVLAPGGRITILSDNERYVHALAAIAAALREADEPATAPRLLGSVALSSAHRFELVDGVHVYSGMPTAEAGHAVLEQSYFDRFWEHGQHTGRHYLVLERLEV